MVADASEHVGRAFAAGTGAGKEIIFAAYGDAA
jgi:hypothetical protein